MPIQRIQLVSGDYWVATLVTALIAAVVVLLLAWRVGPSRFHQRSWPLAGASALFWGIFSTAMVWVLWDEYYGHFFSRWARWLAPLNAGLYAALGYLFWWLAERLPGNTVVNFCLLGGVESIPEHLWGIYGLRILDKTPVLEGVSPLSVLAFAVPEYVIYWGMVLGLGVLLQWGWQRWAERQQGPPNAPASPFAGPPPGSPCVAR